MDYLNEKVNEPTKEITTKQPEEKIFTRQNIVDVCMVITPIALFLLAFVFGMAQSNVVHEFYYNLATNNCNLFLSKFPLP